MFLWCKWSILKELQDSYWEIVSGGSNLGWTFQLRRTILLLPGSSVLLYYELKWSDNENGLDCSLLGAIAMHYAHLGLGLGLSLGLGLELGSGLALALVFSET